jgi:folate-binding protein YgfZ
VNATTPLPLHEFQASLGANFTTINSAEVVADYGDPPAEHAALHETAGVIDFSFRSRLCLTGADRVRFLHGQITNDVKKLQFGEGCYAALTTTKGKMQSDLNVFVLQDELLLDFEPGFGAMVTERLEKYIVADDVQVLDVSSLYGLLTVQGPKAGIAVRAIGLFDEIPDQPLGSVKVTDVTLGEIYLVKHARLDYCRLLTSVATTAGFDLFVPADSLGAVADKLIAAARSLGGNACGWTAFETARIEAGIPRFGVDMDETNLPLECGIEARAVSYAKGCYIGQEVLNRIHSIGHVNRELCGLRLADDLQTLPVKGDKLFRHDKEVGYITSTVSSPRLKAKIALGYVRRDAFVMGTELTIRTEAGQSRVRVVELPFTN